MTVAVSSSDHSVPSWSRYYFNGIHSNKSAASRCAAGNYLVRLYSGVRSLMFNQVVLYFESLSTFVTLERSSVLVDSLFVHRQKPLLLERLGANFTHVRLFNLLLNQV